jgi:hypothetical protein
MSLMILQSPFQNTMRVPIGEGPTSTEMLAFDGWPPLANWSIEDVTAMIYKFGRLMLWENDANNLERIIAKVRCTKL